MHIHFLQHVPFEGIAAIGEWAARRGHRVSGTLLFDEAFAHPGDADMLVVMGGPMSVHDEIAHPWLAEEKRFIAQTVECGVMVLGVCLGAQLLADALGGQVERAAEREIGWYPVTLTEAGRASAVFGRLPGRFEALHWHGDTFSIPPGAVRVAESEACPSQAFEFDGGRVVGLQFHLEATPASWSQLCENASGELTSPGRWVSSAEEMLAEPQRFATANEVLFTLLDAMCAARVPTEGAARL